MDATRASLMSILRTATRRHITEGRENLKSFIIHAKINRNIFMPGAVQ
jgi:hypothetical protein